MEEKIKKAKQIPRYIGGEELYWPEYKKFTKTGDLLPELPLGQAEAREDFELIEKGDK